MCLCAAFPSRHGCPLLRKGAWLHGVRCRVFLPVSPSGLLQSWTERSPECYLVQPAQSVRYLQTGEYTLLFRGGVPWLSEKGLDSFFL